MCLRDSKKNKYRFFSVYSTLKGFTKWNHWIGPLPLYLRYRCHSKDQSRRLANTIQLLQTSVANKKTTTNKAFLLKGIVKILLLQITNYTKNGITIYRDRHNLKKFPAATATLCWRYILKDSQKSSKEEFIPFNVCAI